MAGHLRISRTSHGMIGNSYYYCLSIVTIAIYGGAPAHQPHQTVAENSHEDSIDSKPAVTCVTYKWY